MDKQAGMVVEETDANNEKAYEPPCASCVPINEQKERIACCAVNRQMGCWPAH